MNVIDKVVDKTLEQIEYYLREAKKAPLNNVEACIKYLRVAKLAIDGLEKEADGILIESHFVALFDWEKRADLYKRIEQYLNVDRLRPILDSALAGLKDSLHYLDEDIDSYFQWPGRRFRKKEAADTLNSLIIKTIQFLGSLSGAMALSTDNYIGPSGVNMEELIEIEQLLVMSDEITNEKERQARIIGLVDSCQAKRHKSGMNIISQASGAIYQLSIAFGIEIAA